MVMASILFQRSYKSIAKNSKADILIDLKFKFGTFLLC